MSSRLLTAKTTWQEWASGGKLINASEYIIHPKFFLYPDPSEKVDWDYALIHLAEPAHVASFAKFPKQGSDPADGAPAIIMGWYVLLPPVFAKTPYQQQLCEMYR